jgi:hypothetical protein
MVRKSTIKKNYRLPEELVFWMQVYCKNNGITETDLVVRSLRKFLNGSMRRKLKEAIQRSLT